MNATTNKINPQYSEENSRVFFDPSRCTGCRACEIACSFHHNQSFNPKESSLRVFMNGQSGEVALYFTRNCDLCEGIDVAFCVKACAPKALCLKN